MKGDFSRIRFDARDHFSRVLLQQGRVTLDSDPNEQTAILLHYLRTLARDVIGPCGGPTGQLGFELSLETIAGTQRITIHPGRYYVDGILVENEAEQDYADQPDFLAGSDDAVLERLRAQSTGDVFLYLDVFERHVSYLEDEAIREVALGGPDTSTRAKVVWQVRGIDVAALTDSMSVRRDALDVRLEGDGLDDETRARLTQERDKLTVAINQLAESAQDPDCLAALEGLTAITDARLVARVDPGQRSKDPCLVSPEARYRGAENQLYRVEVHRSSGPGVTPTFKWSRDNGSVATRWLGTEGDDLIVSSARGFTAGSWVELSHDSHERDGQPGMIVKVIKVQGDRLTVDPDTIPSGESIALPKGVKHPKVRRWDQTESEDVTLDMGAVPVVTASDTDPHWLDLEDGIQVQFEPGGSYRSGDYWLIPARVASGSIDWPSALDSAGELVWAALPPSGVEHHFAPLGYLKPNSDGQLEIRSCVCAFDPIHTCARTAAVHNAARPNRKRAAPHKAERPGRAARSGKSK